MGHAGPTFVFNKSKVTSNNDRHISWNTTVHLTSWTVYCLLLGMVRYQQQNKTYSSWLQGAWKRLNNLRSWFQVLQWWCDGRGALYQMERMNSYCAPASPRVRELKDGRNPLKWRLYSFNFFLAQSVIQRVLKWAKDLHLALLASDNIFPSFPRLNLNNSKCLMTVSRLI